jgi:cytochrome c oxidase subunit 2
MINHQCSRMAAFVLIALLLGSGAVHAVEEVDLQAGATLWKFCAFCHNADGLGQERSDAPKVAGDPAWYTERQLAKFRTRVRGSHPEDLPGMQMIVYAYPLIDEAAIRNMAAFIETMPAEPEDPAPDRMANRPRNRPYEWDSKLAVLETGKPADAQRGAELYAATCTQCHGAEGEGIEAVGGPRLDNKQDWYLIRQLKYFKYGARGTDEDDIYGRLMAELGTPETDQDIVDIVAHIMTMSKGPMY